MMNLAQYDYYLVLDLEATCCDQETIKRHQRYGMAEALQLAGIALEGTHHRGIDDARNIAKLLPFILGRQQLNQPSTA